jgi:hypothetical protein
MSDKPQKDLNPTLTHMMGDHNGVISCPVSELLHKTVENIIVALDHGVHSVKNVLAKSDPYTNMNIESSGTKE